MTPPAAGAPLPPPSGPPRPLYPPPVGAPLPPPTARPGVPRWYGVPTQRWGIPSALVPWYVFVAALLLADGIGLAVRALRIPVDGSAVGFTVSIVSYGLIALSVVIVLRRHGIHHVARAIGFAFRPIDLAIGFGGFVGTEILRIVLSAVLVPVVGVPSHGNLTIPSSPVWFVAVGIVLAGVVAPIVEESVARGLLLRAVRARALRVGMRRGRSVGDPGLQVRAAWIAVLVSSAVFMAAHLHEGLDDPRLLPYLIVGTLPFAIVAGWFAIATRRLGAGIVMHMLTNLSAAVIAFATMHR